MSIVYALVNVSVFFLAAPLYEGLSRKLTARVQSRQGPPILQPYYDILKLLGKDRIDSAGNWVFRVAPAAAFASILAVVGTVPFGFRENALNSRVDTITVVYLLTFGGVAVILGALSSRNTFAMIGASREMVTMIMVEPVLAMTLILGAVRAKSLAISGAIEGVAGAGFGASAVVMLLAYLLALQAFVARQPFDITEAESEILGGPFLEYSGPQYALFKYYMMLKQMFYAVLFVTVFCPFTRTGVYLMDMGIQLLATLAVFVLIALVGATHPRFRIDQAVRYYAVLILASLSAVTISVLGF